ncbi:hypothetical protein [Flavobacterium sp. HNIBRBA15423]|uniref:hypothetical protein n=1 Tax=Flavobacterium sp. HNIBRBA15423 TaxID=3458683 RepID=UPI0040440AB5
MNKIFKNIISPLALLLTKGEKFEEKKSSVEIYIAKGSKKIGNTEMVVIQHYNPIVKFEL